MSERLKFQGKLAASDQEARLLGIRIRGGVESLRDLLDPTAQPEELEHDLIADQALRLSSTVIELKRVLAEIREIKKLLLG